MKQLDAAEYLSPVYLILLDVFQYKDRDKGVELGIGGGMLGGEVMGWEVHVVSHILNLGVDQIGEVLVELVVLGLHILMLHSLRQDVLVETPAGRQIN